MQIYYKNYMLKNRAYEINKDESKILFDKMDGKNVKE